MPAATSSPIAPALGHLVDTMDAHRLGAGLMSALDAIPDPRKRRGVRHQFTVILALAACAVLAGNRSFVAIGEWAANVSDQVRASLGIGGAVADESTIRRTLQRLDGDDLDTAIGAWAAAQTAPEPTTRRLIAVDGKRVRGSGSATVEPRHLLGAIDHAHGVVLAQRDVDGKTNEITEFAPLLDTVELTDAVITADALHAQRAHADYLVLERGAHYLLTVKGNQPTLFAQLKALPWKDAPVVHITTDTARGRVTKRSVKVVTVFAGILFPHARQAIQITRKARRKDSKMWTTETAYAVTSLTAAQASAAALATWIRRHWHIENRLHRVRDVTFGEDAPQVRTGNGPAPWHPCAT